MSSVFIMERPSHLVNNSREVLKCGAFACRELFSLSVDYNNIDMATFIQRERVEAAQVFSPYSDFLVFCIRSSAVSKRWGSDERTSLLCGSLDESGSNLLLAVSKPEQLYEYKGCLRASNMSRQMLFTDRSRDKSTSTLNATKTDNMVLIHDIYRRAPLDSLTSAPPISSNFITRTHRRTTTG